MASVDRPAHKRPRFFLALLAVVFAVLAFTCARAGAADLKPSENGDFGHYTFALTWQPGMCSTAKGCLPDQPRVPLIGLHGLWPSRPRALIERHLDVHVWWARGCEIYGVHSSGRPPSLAPRLEHATEATMPHFSDNLLVHEYWKHVACFGFDPNAFFGAELAMRRSVVESRFARYIEDHVGRRVRRDAVLTQFTAAFRTTHAKSLQLQCARNAAGEAVLTELWITIKASLLAVFPSSASLMDAVQDQTTCPRTFLVPAWPE